jgi:hypothetical protein
MPVIDAHRAYLEFTRSLTTDDQGNEVLARLTYDETEWYFRYLEDFYGLRNSRAARTANDLMDARNQYLELHGKHETARLMLVFAEISSRPIGAGD